MRAHTLTTQAAWVVANVVLCGTASAGNGFAVGWYTTDGGGGRSAGGGYAVAGTAAQPDAGTMSGGGYLLNGGFWSGGVPVTTDVADEPPTAPAAAPAAFRVHPASPNPFNPLTTIRYELPAATRVSMEVFDPAGKRVRVLVDEPRPAGPHTVRWDGRDGTGRSVASGVYLVRTTAGSWSSRQKLLLLK